jgi:hypothetical protein
MSAQEFIRLDQDLLEAGEGVAITLRLERRDCMDVLRSKLNTYSQLMAQFSSTLSRHCDYQHAGAYLESPEYTEEADESPLSSGLDPMTRLKHRKSSRHNRVGKQYGHDQNEYLEKQVEDNSIVPDFKRMDKVADSTQRDVFLLTWILTQLPFYVSINVQFQKIR